MLTTTDPQQLQSQLLSLQTIRDNARRGAATTPVIPETMWNGPAYSSYLAYAEELSTRLRTLVIEVEAAYNATSRELASVGS